MIGVSKKTAWLLTLIAMLTSLVGVFPSDKALASSLTYEFEEGAFDGCTAESWEKVDEDVNGNMCDISDWSGTGFANLGQAGTSVTVTVDVEKSGLYELFIRYCQPFDAVKKVQYLNINGVNQGDTSFPFCTSWQTISAGYISLNEGKNTIQIKAYWGYTLLDSLTISTADSSIANLNPVTSLVCENASGSTKRLYNYLRSVYGKHILSGQQEICGSHNYQNSGSDTEFFMAEEEFEYILDNTGKEPAVRGFDLLNYTSEDYDDRTIERIIEWVNVKGGIATVCWHWFSPMGATAANSFYTDSTTFSISKALEDGTEENLALLTDIHKIANQLLRLKEADVPILWRPLHEAEGAWFWWGAEGAEPCKELYLLLYEILVDEYKLDNLIWEWNQYTYPTSMDWYPGDDYVDIVGYDKYNCADGVANLSAISSTFYNLVAQTEGRKMVAMMENDSIPAVDAMINENAAWLYFCPWYGWHLTGEQNNPIDNLIEVYQSDYCITLDELPDLKNFTLDGYGSDISKPTITYGDIYIDGEVDSKDLINLSQYISKMASLNDEQLGNADVFLDGEVNSKDIVKLAQYLAKMPVTLGENP